jgi:hypothetical protein
MELTDLQLTLTVLVLATAAALVFFDFRRKQRQQRQPQRVTSSNTVGRHRPTLRFDSATLEYAPARKLAFERPLEPLVASATIARPPVVQAAQRETVTIQMAGQPENDITLPAFTIDAALWERLVASMPQHDLLTSGRGEPTPQPESKLIDVAPGALQATYQVIESGVASRWPTGMLQQPAFQKLLDVGEPFSGLVVSIGINDSDSSMWHSQGLMQSVGSYLSGLLHEKDFSCRTSYDEFVLACRGEHGAQSQRRLNHISERLWDYQLRGMGACSILFSWGGVQVQDQPLAEAVASAVDRMRQTKRSGSPAISKVHRTAV